MMVCADEDGWVTQRTLRCYAAPLSSQASMSAAKSPVGVRTRVGHAERAKALVLQLEVLIGKLVAVDRLTATPIAAGDVAALAHCVGGTKFGSAEAAC